MIPKAFLFSASFKQETNKLFKLALPILLAQLALTGLGVADTIMSGRLGTNDLAAIGLGSNILLPVFMLATGILLAITPLVSKANGSGDQKTVSLYVIQGLWLAVPLGVLSLLILINISWLLDLLSLNSKVYQLTEDYLFYIAFGMPGIALYQALRFFWEGLENTLPTMWISFFALAINIPLNAIFIYGLGPVEPMGAAGCGVASAIVMWSMLLIALFYVLKNKGLFIFFKAAANVSPSWQKGLASILALGVPNAFALLFEISLFSFIALFITVLGATVIAAHQIAISFTSVAFMLPLSFAMALTVRVGKGFGEDDLPKVVNTLYTGFFWALLIGFTLALVSFYLRDFIVSLYSFDFEVIAIASSLLVFAAMYQVFDAIQVTAAGALRGFHDTKVTMWVTLLCYWGVGLGLGYVLSFSSFFLPAMGVAGFWLGIVLGLFIAAILLSLRLRFVFNAHFK
jgi:MATE family multidrug resistance protein